MFDYGNLGADEARISLPADELDRWEWVDLAQLDNFVIDRIAHRGRAAISAPGSAWSDPVARLRRPLPTERGAWRASIWPR
jgi:hypothetical protein